MIPNILSPRRVQAVCIVFLMALVDVSAAAGRDCIKSQPKQVLESADAELAFSGKVAELTTVGEPVVEASRERPQVVRATCDVDRVWMGRVSKRFDVYMVYPSSSNAPNYQRDRSYVVIARPCETNRREQRPALGPLTPSCSQACTALISIQ